jgi:signal transduction histidine kinase/ActR/RegA family two-component response regulator
MTLSSSAAVPAKGEIRAPDLLGEQVRLLYGNGHVGVGVTVIAAAVLGRLQWSIASHPIVLIWCLYMFVVSGARFLLGQRYRRSAPSNRDSARWANAFGAGAGLAGVGWGAAGVLLYSEAYLTNQVFLVFIVGGMMLGAAAVLAPRPEAYLAFLIPTGLGPAIRLVVHGDEAHVAMGLMAGLFTLATVIITRRIHLTIVSSLNLKLENQNLVDDLQAAKNQAEALNAHLEIRVQQRTAELERSTEQLRIEVRQRQQMEEELQRARKLESLGVLAGGIAHDFNNFLTVVQGNIEMAKMQLTPEEPALAILNQTESACLRAAFLASQLLTFAKGGVPVRRLVPVAKLITDAVQLAQAGGQTNIEVRIPEDPGYADVDPGQMGQVLHNILLNARQAIADDGTIEVRAENVGGDPPSGDTRVRISVRDFGCGIPADVLPRIFDPYFTTKPGSSGLGLATAYAIVAKHGGHLSVESKPGHGTTFAIELPAAQEPPIPPAPGDAKLRTGTERLLIMDDEDALRKLLEALLTKLGYEVESARDGDEAIALCESARASGRGFDAALLDLTVVRGMGGEKAAACLKELDPDLKLIVSSGYSESPVMADFRKYGFDDVLPKPWAVGELSQVFRRIFGE